MCGNDVVETGEECDDGNLVDGDGCESDCQVGPVLCGNGVIDPGEKCDDGNSDPDDGCGSSCATECGFLCLAVGELCIPGFHAVQCTSAVTNSGIDDDARPALTMTRSASLSLRRAA